MKQGWHIGVVIPARNEENHIVEVLEGLPEIVDVAVVVNDGSTDGTADKVTDATASCEVILLHGHGDGVGASIDRGHKHLLGLFTAPFISVVMAGDGQMNPNDMEALIQPLLDGTADHVKGNRERHADGFNQMPQHRQLASKVLTWFTTLAAGQPLSDPQCGFTATTSNVLETWDWDRSWAGYGYPNFWLINLSKQGLSLIHI